MKKWYKESYFDPANWILDNFDKLNLDSNETVLLLLIDLCKNSHRNITYDYLKEKMRMNQKQIDGIIAGLVAKHYLKLSINSRGLVFDISSLFEFDPERYEIAENRDLYDVVGDIFGKPLSLSDLQKMNDLLDCYGKEKFIEALRIAEAQKKLKMSYIEGILKNVRE